MSDFLRRRFEPDANGGLTPHAWGAVFVCLIALGMLIRWAIVPAVEWVL
jgi:hypothetical protein